MILPGRKSKTLLIMICYDTGTYSVDWDGTDNFGNKVTSGIYFARMSVGQMQKTIKMNLVK
jgi:flagellar hook assembly protein FlgD